MNQFELFANLLFICVNILAEWRILIYHFEKIVLSQKVWYDFIKMDKTGAIIDGSNSCYR